MPKQVSQIELDAIWNIACRFPDGAALEDIIGELAPPLPRRTLQRRLASLVEQDRLTTTGRGRALRYQPFLMVNRVCERSEGPSPDHISSYQHEGYFHLSPEGESIRQAIQKPIFQRQPVGFDRSFLDRYLPNETFYLSPEIRHRLLALGRGSDAAKQPAGTHARKVYNRLLIDLSWNSSRLEGNTYSLLETERLLELGECADGKTVRDAQMILNHKAAIELLVDQAAQIGFNRYTIFNLHALLSQNLLADRRACGRLRSISVGISGTVYHPLGIPQLIEECFDQMLAKATAIADPFEQTFFVMVHMPYLQPFEDVNKRTSRLAANIPLIKNNLSPLSFVNVPNQIYVDAILAVYELNRIELLRDVFVWAYERSCGHYAAVCQSLGEPDPFLLQHRQLIAEAVGTVVRQQMNKQKASVWIQQEACKKLPEPLRERFIEAVETAVMSLHSGNIAQFRLLPYEYEAWQVAWR